MWKPILACIALSLTLPLAAIESILPNDGTFETDGGYFTNYWCDRPNSLSWQVVEDADGGRCLRLELPGGMEHQGVSGEPFEVQAHTTYTCRMKIQLDEGVSAQAALVNCDWKDTTFMTLGNLGEDGLCAVEFTPKFSGRYWLLLDFANTSQDTAGATIDDIQLFKGNLRMMALDSIPEGENLLTGNNSYEGGDGFFSQIWAGQGSPLELVEEDDAPVGCMYATTMVDADDCHSYTGPRLFMDKDREYVFSCWIKADRPTTCEFITVHTAWKDTQMHKFHVTTEWNRIEIPFTVKFSSDYSLVLELTNRNQATPVQISFDAVKLEFGTQATPFAQKKAFYAGAKLLGDNNGIFFPEENPTLKILAIDKRDELPQEATCTITVSDYNQRVVREFSQPAVWNEKGICRLDIPMPVDRLGLFVYRLKWTDADGQPLSETQGVYTLVQPPIPDDPEILPYLGVNSNVPVGVERLGVRWAEVYLYWYSLMPTPDTIDGNDHLKRMRALKERGFKVKLSLVHLPAAPNWAHRPEEVAEAKAWGLPETNAFFGTDEALEKLSIAFEDFIRRAGDDIDLLEIGGEDELVSGSEPYYRRKYSEAVRHGNVFGPVCTDLARITTVYLQAAHRANPTLPIAAGRPSGGSAQVADFPFSREVLTQVQGDFQYFPMDCYSFNMRYLDPVSMLNVGSPNREFQSVFKNANKMTHAYLHGQKPFVSEYGFAIDNRLAPDHPLQQEETRRMTSAVLTARLLGSPFFFWFNTMGAIESTYYDYGMWHDGVPMLLIPAMSQVARAVERVRQYDSRLGTEDSNLKMGVFGQKDVAYLALWTEQNDNDVKLALPENAKCADFLGNPMEIPGDGVFTAHLLPTYISLEGEDAYEKLHAAMTGAEDRANGLVCTLALDAGQQGFLVVRHTDPESTDQASITYSFGDNAPATAFKQPGEPFPWIVPVDGLPADGGEIKVTLEDSRQNATTLSMSFTPTRLDMGQNLIRKFGDDRKDIVPPDPWIRWDGHDDLGGEIYIEVSEESVTIIAEVTDDIHKNTRTGGMIWDGDCLQFAILPDFIVRADAAPAGYGPRDVDIGLALAANGPECVVFHGDYHDSLENGRDFRMTRDEDNGVTSYRIELQREALGLTRQGQYFGFACVVFDDDEGAGESYWFQSSPGLTGKNVNQFHIYQLP